MVRILGDIVGSAVYATDGKIGKVTDCFFDEDSWGVRFLLVDVGSWLTNREVLIPSHSVERTNLNARRIDLDISKQKVKASPEVDAGGPISRRYETTYYQYYGYAPYWPEAGVFSAEPLPGVSETAPETSPETDPPDASADETDQTTHLRSARNIGGLHVKARNGQIGHVEDLLADEQSWMVESVVIDTSRWPGGKPVLIPADRIERTDWGRGAVVVRATTEEIRTSPEFEASYARRS